MRRLVVGWVAALMLLSLSAPALAHAVLVESVPEDGARLDSPPAEAMLRFNEPVRPVSVTLIGPGGVTLPLPAPAARDGALRVALPGGLAVGTHVLSYRVSSADGHPVAGSLLFGIGAEPERPVELGGATPPATLLAAAAVRALHYGSLLAAVGGGLFLVLVAGRWSPLNRRLRPGLCLGVGVAALVAVLNAGLAGAVLEGAPLSTLAGASPWIAGLTSTAGPSALLALLGLIAVALGLALEERGTAGRVLLVTGAVGAALALATTGHAATAEPRWLSVPLVALHSLAVAFWIGSFWPLAVLLRTEPPAESLRLVRRFSGWAVPAVAVLLLAGAGLSALQLADPRTILTTAYGQIWTGKIICALALLALAAVNRWRLTPRLEVMGGQAAARLRASVHTEMVVAALVVLFTAGLGTTPPPRTESLPVFAEKPAGFSTAVVARGRTAIVTVTPATPGANRVEMRLTGPDGAPLDALEVSAELALPAAGIEGITRPLPKVAPGVYAADGMILPVAGAWAVRLDALVSDFEKVPFRAAVPVAVPVGR